MYIDNLYLHKIILKKLICEVLVFLQIYNVKNKNKINLVKL